MTDTPSPTVEASGDAARWTPSLIVIAAGVCAALHIGKLPPAIPALREALGLTLVQAGFLLSLVQAAGMLAGLAFGALADGLGPLRSMVLGLVMLSLASAAGGLCSGVQPLLLLRALEGCGFLMTVLPAPGLVRQFAPAGRAAQALGLWGAYMPLATATALLTGPWCIGALGWRAWWWLLGGLSGAMALLLAVTVRQPRSAGTAPRQQPLLARLRQTLAAPGPWLVALCFALYSGQWLAVVGFLPAICTQAGLGSAATGVLTATVAGANMLGNIAAGRLQQRGVAPQRLLAAGYLAMGLGAACTFAGFDGGAAATGPGPVLRYAAVLSFSALGGLIPATLFTLAVRLAPGPHTLSSTVGWVQQWSSLGQFAGPPLVAALAGWVGGWQWTWLATGACSLAGLALLPALQRRLASAA